MVTNNYNVGNYNVGNYNVGNYNVGNYYNSYRVIIYSYNIIQFHLGWVLLKLWVPGCRWKTLWVLIGSFIT